MACHTRAAVSGWTVLVRLMTWETVVLDTPASPATSLMVAMEVPLTQDRIVWEKAQVGSTFGKSLEVLMKIATAVLAALLAVSAGAQDLPVTKVVLFTSGVGYFEHAGTVSGNASVTLTFTDSQINDVLKSLILRDSAGTVGVVGYPSQDPLERSLGSFAVDLSGPGGLAALLPQLRGASLTLMTPAEVTGKLVGIDTRTEKGKDGDRTETWLTIAGDGLKVVPLSSVSQVKLLDPKLDQELSQALALLAGSRDSRKKTITAQFSGTGSRQVSVGYIAEAPVWKTSYRLDLSGGKPYLQAWAIVENTGESDWNQVRLSLVSGRPVSFIQDLYTPLYVQRPVYYPETEAGPAPRVNSAATGFNGPAAEAQTGEAMPAPAPAPMVAQKSLGRAGLVDSLMDEDAVPLRGSGFKQASSGSQAGELFQFSLQAPISLARHQSALIPLAATDVTAQKVSLFNESVDSVHPQNSVWITNSTGLRLPAGPVTIYDGGAYAGDALTDTLLEKDKRLWSYATDLAVRTDLSSNDNQLTTKITVVRGVLNVKKDLTWKRTYRFTNAGAEARTVLVEHPVNADRNLVDPQPTEKTPDYYRFTVSAPAGGQAELSVRESRTVTETQGLSGWRADQLLAVVQSSGPLSAAVKTALQKAADLKTQADKAAQDATTLSQRKNEQESGQARIRNNIETVGRDSTQGQAYLKRLMDSETLIDQLNDQLTAARKTQATAQAALDDYLKNLSVE